MRARRASSRETPAVDRRQAVGSECEQDRVRPGGEHLVDDTNGDRRRRPVDDVFQLCGDLADDAQQRRRIVDRRRSARRGPAAGRRFGRHRRPQPTSGRPPVAPPVGGGRRRIRRWLPGQLRARARKPRASPAHRWPRASTVVAWIGSFVQETGTPVRYELRISSKFRVSSAAEPLMTTRPRRKT